MKKVALLPAYGLGDGLIYMVLGYNFFQSGFKVAVFSSPLCELKDWFSDHEIYPFLNDIQPLASYDLVIASDHSSLVSKLEDLKNVVLLREEQLDKTKSFAQNLTELCKSKFQLQSYEKKNGIKAPPSLVHRLYKKRVILHPMSSDSKKNWSRSQFLELGSRLKSLGYDPVFCVSPSERNAWPSSPLFPMVKDLAAFVYESGYMIGNDSGVGHLASSLGIPTVSLFARKRYAHLWRPGFGTGLVAYPPPVLVGSFLKQKFWRQTLTVSRVLNQFKRVVKMDREKNASASFSQ